MTKEAKWVADLWVNHRWKFFILLPIVLLVVFKDVIMAFIVESGIKEVKQTEQADQKIKEVIKEKEIKAAEHEAKAEAIKDSPVSVDRDWHKKR